MAQITIMYKHRKTESRKDNNTTTKSMCFNGPRLALLLSLPLLLFIHKHSTENPLSVLTLPKTVPTLLYVPLQPFHACTGQIEKIVCTVTYLVGDDGNNTSETTTIPIQAVDDIESINKFCDYLILSATFDNYAEIPICVQDAERFGALVYQYEAESVMNVIRTPDIRTTSQIIRAGTASSSATGGTTKEIDMIKSDFDANLQWFIATQFPKATRKIYSKRVDFPNRYKFQINWWDPEPGRDGNYGNLVWRYAAHKMINPITINNKLYPTTYNYEDDKLEDADALVIATANTIHLTKTPILKEMIETITKRIMARNVPTIILGLGVQAEFEHDGSGDTSTLMNNNLTSTKLKLPFTFQKKFLFEISKRQTNPAIGVRGDFTKTVCRNSDIYNCVSMGCPSLTISRDTNLGRTLEKNWNNLLESVQDKKSIRIALAMPAFSSSEYNTEAAMVLALYARILQKHGYDSVTIIEQSETDGLRFKKYIDNVWNKKSYTVEIATNKIRLLQYYSVESWLKGAASKFDLCISARIHGSMPFISSGIPVIAIPTDYRIMELLLSMKIPYIMPADLVVGKKLNKADIVLSLLQNASNTNFTEFELNRRNKLQGWKSILADAGLEMDPALLRIINTPL